MSEIEKTIAEELAKVPVAVREKFLLMAQGAAVAVECAREAAGTGAMAPSVACGDSSLPEGARTGETDCHGAAPLAMTGDEGTPHQSPAATASPRGSRDGGAA